MDPYLWAIDTRLFTPEQIPEQLALQAVELSSLSAGPAPQVDPTTQVGDVAVIDVTGRLRSSPSIWRRWGFDMEATLPEIEVAIRKATESAKAGGVVLRISSPGGSAFGTPEVAGAVHAARQRKPVVAYIQDLGASAAYHIASQASEIYSNPIAHVGSVGVFALVVDMSARAEAVGLKFIPVVSTPLKGAFTPGTAVKEEHVAELQRNVDSVAKLFVADIARGRGISAEVAETFHDARVHVGAEAAEIGMTDGLADIGEVIELVQAQITNRKGRAARMAAERRQAAAV